MHDIDAINFKTIAVLDDVAQMGKFASEKKGSTVYANKKKCMKLDKVTVWLS